MDRFDWEFLTFIIVLIVSTLLLCVLMVWGGVEWDRYSCKQRWDTAGYQTTYSMSTGCMVNYKGQWMPEGTIRIL